MQPLADLQLGTAECSCVNELVDFVEEASQQEGIEITALLKGSFRLQSTKIVRFSIFSADNANAPF